MGPRSGVFDPRVGPRVGDEAIGDLAGRQYGVVSRDQLIALGLSPDMIKARVKLGRLLVLHRGVYAVGHTSLPTHARDLAAVLAVDRRRC